MANLPIHAKLEVSITADRFTVYAGNEVVGSGFLNQTEGGEPAFDDNLTASSNLLRVVGSMINSVMPNSEG